jgi:hypothetical protein
LCVSPCLPAHLACLRCCRFDAAQEVFDRPIEIYAHEDGARQPRKTSLTELPDALRGVTPFRLTFHGENHYNAVIMHRPTDRERWPLAMRHSRHLQDYRTSEE